MTKITDKATNEIKKYLHFNEENYKTSPDDLALRDRVQEVLLDWLSRTLLLDKISNDDEKYFTVINYSPITGFYVFKWAGVTEEMYSLLEEYAYTCMVDEAGNARHTDDIFSQISLAVSNFKIIDKDVYIFGPHVKAVIEYMINDSFKKTFNCDNNFLIKFMPSCIHPSALGGTEPILNFRNGVFECYFKILGVSDSKTRRVMQ